VSRLEEIIPLVVRLLSGDTVTHHGTHFQLDDAVIATPRPIQQPVPVLIGGNGPRVLQLAAQHASIIGFSGLGRTRADGHSHDPLWLPHQIDTSIQLAATATPTGSTPIREALVQHVEITEHRSDRLDALATEFEVAREQLDNTPYVLIGTLTQIVEQLHAQQERWGFTSYVVREPSLADSIRIRNAVT
jgi:alkanesulfonate monooxygenase SsuD/methylene tetrahydromethanopterin reductase-like flavin-dependent oxidoreductase (luciferase family)